MTKEEIESLIREIIKEELYCHIKTWHLGIINEK